MPRRDNNLNAKTGESKNCCFKSRTCGSVQKMGRKKGSVNKGGKKGAKFM